MDSADEDTDEFELSEDEFDLEGRESTGTLGGMDLETCKKLHQYISNIDTTCKNCGFLPEAHDRIDPPPRWSYTPLQGETEIRVLVIRPPIVGRESEVHGKLIHCNLDQERGPRYPLVDFEAVSYTWRDYDIWGQNSAIDLDSPPPLDSTVHLDGSALKVTSNCLAALKRIRLSARARVVWVDAICVNQDDLDERGHQVRLMSKIYTIAKRVLIYPGKPRDEDDMGLQYIASPRFQDVVLTKDDDKRRAAIDALSDLFKQPYFYRVWILQEATLAREAVLLYGRHEIPLNHLRPRSLVGTSSQLVNNLDAIVQEVPNRPRMLDLRQRAAWNDILDLLEVARGCAATDARDKVFSLYGLLTFAEQIDFAPNYRETVHQTYTRTAVNLIRTHGLIPILIRAVFPGKLKGLARWVPDWTVQSVPGFQARAMAANHGLVSIIKADYGDPYGFETTGYRVGNLRRLVLLGFSFDICTPTVGEYYCVDQLHVRRLYAKYGLGEWGEDLWCYLVEQEDAFDTPRGDGDDSGILLLSNGGSTFNFAGLCTYRAPIRQSWVGKEDSDKLLNMAGRCSRPVGLLVDRVTEILRKMAMSVERTKDHEIYVPSVTLSDFSSHDIMVVGIETLCLPIAKEISWRVHLKPGSWVEGDRWTTWVEEMVILFEQSFKPESFTDRTRAVLSALAELSPEDIRAEVRRTLQLPFMLALDSSALQRCQNKGSAAERYPFLTDIIHVETLRFEAHFSPDEKSRGFS